jgi:hypothetical protein
VHVKEAFDVNAIDGLSSPITEMGAERHRTTQVAEGDAANGWAAANPAAHVSQVSQDRSNRSRHMV